MKHHLTERQRKFCEVYLETGCKYAAASAAGFKASYAPFAYRQPAVQEYIEQRRSEMFTDTVGEVISFLYDLMSGKLKASDLRKTAAIELGRRAGLWRNEHEAIKLIEEGV